MEQLKLNNNLSEKRFNYSFTIHSPLNVQRFEECIREPENESSFHRRTLKYFMKDEKERWSSSEKSSKEAFSIELAGLTSTYCALFSIYRYNISYLYSCK